MNKPTNDNPVDGVIYGLWLARAGNWLKLNADGKPATEFDKAVEAFLARYDKGTITEYSMGVVCGALVAGKFLADDESWTDKAAVKAAFAACKSSVIGASSPVNPEPTTIDEPAAAPVLPGSKDMEAIQQAMANCDVCNQVDGFVVTGKLDSPTAIASGQLSAFLSGGGQIEEGQRAHLMLAFKPANLLKTDGRDPAKYLVDCLAVLAGMYAEQPAGQGNEPVTVGAGADSQSVPGDTTPQPLPPRGEAVGG